MKKLLIILFLGISFSQEKTFEELSSDIIQEHEKNIQSFEDFRKEISDDVIQSWNEGGELFQSFYDNGNKKFETYYLLEYDKDHGTNRFYNEDGILSWEMTYMVGNRHGPDKNFHSNGQISTLSYNFQNVPYGPKISYSKDGKIKESLGYYKKYSYERNGPSISYYSNGNIESKIYFKEGKLHGSRRDYYENGQLKFSTFYINQTDKTITEGPFVSYYENGQIQLEVSYFKDGKENGPFKYYDENGQIILEGNYENGKVIDSKEY